MLLEQLEQARGRLAAPADPRSTTGACPQQVAALPWRKSLHGIEVMLVTSRDSGRWVLPKGWPEAEESLAHAAAREAREEAGISGAVERRSIGSYFYSKVSGKRPGAATKNLCQVHVFAIAVDRLAERWPERKQRKRQWFPIAEAATRVREADLSRLIAGFGPAGSAVGA